MLAYPPGSRRGPSGFACGAIRGRAFAQSPEGAWDLVRLLSIAALIAVALAGLVPALSLPLPPPASPTRLDAPVATPPARIVSLSSEADELLAGLVPVDSIAAMTFLAGVPDYSNVSESAAQVGALITHIADVEPIILMAPDLVVVNDFNRYEVVYLMQQAGLKVHRLKYPVTLADIRENLMNLGRAVGNEPGAEALVAGIDAAAARVARAVAGRAPVKTLFLSGSFFAQGHDSLPDDLIRLAGGVNVLKGPSRTVSPEEILFLSPDVIVLNPGQVARFHEDPALATLLPRLAVGEWRELQPPSQFAGRALETWARLLHPDLAANAHGGGR